MLANHVYEWRNTTTTHRPYGNFGLFRLGGIEKTLRNVRIFAADPVGQRFAMVSRLSIYHPPPRADANSSREKTKKQNFSASLQSERLIIVSNRQLMQMYSHLRFFFQYPVIPVRGMKASPIFLCLLFTLPILTLASQTELPVESFFKNYQYNEVKLSPDGNWLAALAPTKKRVGLVVVDLQKRAAQCVYADRTADVHWFEWANTNRLLFSFSKEGYLIGGLMAVNRDGSRLRTLVDVLDYRTRYFKSIPGSTNEILVTSVAYSPEDTETGWWFPKVERMNIFSGYMTEEGANPGRVFRWLTDHACVVRVGLSLEGTRFKVLHRATEKAKWESLGEFAYDEDGIDPIGFEYDNQTLLVTQYGERDKLGVYRYDVTEKKIKDLGASHANADLGTPLFCGTERVLAGIAYVTERPEIFWLSPKHKAIQASVDKALPGTLNLPISISADDRKFIFLASSDRAPGTFHLLNSVTMKMEKLFDKADWIDPEQMAEMKPIQYQARDGLTIHGYLTIPKGANGKALPLIVNPHGGPITRDVWEFDPEVQFFANRGYAVLRMNFRGSTGYGKRFLEAGYRQWGLKQQDDITDGVKWAIAQGIADPKRICIYGASYGGYAALIGLEHTPELYRCGICYAGVSDVRRVLKHSVADLAIMRAQAAEMIGDLKKDSEHLKEISPLTHVDQIQVPVLLAYGKLDPKVPISTGRELARLLRKKGKLYAFLEKDDEGHGFFKEENKLELWKKVDEFLKANLN